MIEVLAWHRHPDHRQTVVLPFREALWSALFSAYITRRRWHLRRHKAWSPRELTAYEVKTTRSTFVVVHWR